MTRKKAVYEWLRQHPWVLVSLLAGIPLMGIAAINQSLSSSTSQPDSKASPPTAPAIAPPSPPLQISPSPQKPVQSSRLVPPVSTQAAPKAPVAPHPAPPSAQQFAQLSADSVVEIRVAIAEGVPSVSVGTSIGGDILDTNGKRLLQLPAQAAYTAQPDGDGIYLGSWKLPAQVLIDPDPRGAFYLGERAYRGRLLLVADGGRLWAVNYVNMRNYLYSVVGSEVYPDWPMHALKAQAVAARSYALVHHFRPRSSLYDICATEYCQVYSGIERETDTVRQAVNNTGGEFVSHRGGVVESLYAASDDIVMEAFEGRGMSQLGAHDLAKKGYTYVQILAHYYPGTAVGRIEVDTE
jgi:peptidoglycan hydrolase-like amidase